MAALHPRPGAAQGCARDRHGAAGAPGCGRQPVGEYPWPGCHHRV